MARVVATRRGIVRAGLVLAVVLVLAGVAVALLTRGISTRGGVEVMGGQEIDDTHLLLMVASCGGDPDLVSLAEEEDAVTVVVESTTGQPAGDCQDVVEVELMSPLGDRTVVDGTSGQTEPIQDGSGGG